MREIKACGVFVVRGKPLDAFLLMKHRDRWDLPKGHLDQGETDLECALRELEEETGIARADVELASEFRYAINYEVESQRFGERCRKTLVIYLARLVRDMPIVLSEHVGYEWFPWQPPRAIQKKTIDPVVSAVREWTAASGWGMTK